MNRNLENRAHKIKHKLSVNAIIKILIQKYVSITSYSNNIFSSVPIISNESLKLVKMCQVEKSDFLSNQLKSEIPNCDS